MPVNNLGRQLMRQQSGLCCLGFQPVPWVPLSASCARHVKDFGLRSVPDLQLLLRAAHKAQGDTPSARTIRCLQACYTTLYYLGPNQREGVRVRKSSPRVASQSSCCECNKRYVCSVEQWSR